MDLKTLVQLVRSAMRLCAMVRRATRTGFFLLSKAHEAIATCEGKPLGNVARAARQGGRIAPAYKYIVDWNSCAVAKCINSKRQYIVSRETGNDPFFDCGRVLFGSLSRARQPGHDQIMRLRGVRGGWG